MRSFLRALSLSTAFMLVGLAASSGATFGTCEYRCHNTATGLFTLVQSAESEADCCGGNVVCPAGTTYAGTLFWSGAHGPMRCAA